MHKIAALGALCLAISITTNSHAALPPLYETLNEYKALLASPELTEKLTSADVIENIERHDHTFLIKSNKHTMSVDIIYDPQKLMGPAKFHFVFHDPEAVTE